MNCLRERSRGLADLEALRQAMPDAEECFQRGERLRAKNSYAAAAPWYRRAAEQGHAHGQTQLASLRPWSELVRKLRESQVATADDQT